MAAKPVNKVRDAIDNDGVVIGPKCITLSPQIIELYGLMGVDFVWISFEHRGPSPYDSDVLENLTRAADVHDLSLIVRLPHGDPPLVRKVLDSGVSNLLLARVNSAEEVEDAIEAARFEYQGKIGQRGASESRSNNWKRLDDYMTIQDNSVCIGAMIETQKALDNLEDILTVPELGFANVGPYDLSAQLGHPAEPNHPEVKETEAEIKSICDENNVAMQYSCYGTDAAEDAISAIEDGYQIIRIGGDLAALEQVFEPRIQQIKQSQSYTDGTS